MRPEVRSTRSARIIPHSGKNDEARPARPVSLPPTSPSHSISGRIESSWRKQVRHRMTDEQLSKLDALYEWCTHPTTSEKQALGNEIGLGVKTVSVWFQNKRQTDKKARRLSASSSSSSEQSRLKRVSSPSINTTLRKRDRRPHYTDNYKAAASRRKLLLSAVDDSQSTYETDFDKSRTRAKHNEPQEHGHTEGPGNTVIPPQELWKHLLSSSPSASEHASSDVDPMERSASTPADIFADGLDSTMQGSSKRSRMLEWVCDRQTKRRHNNQENSAELEDTNEICHNCPQSRRPDFDTAISLLTLPGDAGLSEDVIRAASLLLCFKYSAQNPRRADHT